jgi:hypothetical protein
MSRRSFEKAAPRRAAVARAARLEAEGLTVTLLRRTNDASPLERPPG